MSLDLSIRNNFAKRFCGVRLNSDFHLL